MKQENLPEIVLDEISQKGLGSELYSEAKEHGGKVNVRNVYIWLQVQKHGQVIIQKLLNNFDQVEVLEHYNTYYKLRIPRNDKSIGFVFGLIEQSKEEANVVEYSISQTTLEQIFQYFANLEQDDKINTVFKQEGGAMVKRQISLNRAGTLRASQTGKP